MLKYIGEFERLKDFGFEKVENKYIFEDITIFAECFREFSNFHNTREVVLTAYGYDGEEVEINGLEILYTLIENGLIKNCTTKTFYIIADSKDKFIYETLDEKEADKIIKERDNKIKQWREKNNKCEYCDYSCYYSGDVDENNAPECFKKEYYKEITLASCYVPYGMYDKPKYQCGKAMYKTCPIKRYYSYKVEKVVEE